MWTGIRSGENWRGIRASRHEERFDMVSKCLHLLCNGSGILKMPRALTGTTRVGKTDSLAPNEQVGYRLLLYSMKEKARLSGVGHLQELLRLGGASSMCRPLYETVQHTQIVNAYNLLLSTSSWVSRWTRPLDLCTIGQKHPHSKLYLWSQAVREEINECSERVAVLSEREIMIREV